jgi:hypothetical protein
MTAGRGIIHSEMPQQVEGRMRGFQLWVNLPAKDKMKPASYRDIDPSEIPAVDLTGGGRAKVIAGTFEAGEARITGPAPASATDVTYLDVELPAGVAFSHPVKRDYSAYLYVFEGALDAGPVGDTRAVETNSGALLSIGDEIRVEAGAEGARFLLLAARALKEPVVQHGPFVMNTRDEIEQAIRDYQSGQFANA